MVVHEAVGVAYPMISFIDMGEGLEEYLPILFCSSLKTGLFSFPREVMWYTAPEYSMWRGRDMTER